ncbi:MAG: Rrf2 family transcriptional regulator [bacterium]|nr:Rrf2 family transcriptional regulator [bacterium]
MFSPLFKISERDHLGMIIMSTLAGTFHDSERWVSLEEIAQWGKFSQGYLEQVAAPLRAAGLITSRKGMGGGYRLAKQPSAITIEDVVQALHGSYTLVPCLDKTMGCDLTASCSSHYVWSFLQKGITETLQKTSLADLIKKQRT